MSRTSRTGCVAATRAEVIVCVGIGLIFFAVAAGCLRSYLERTGIDQAVQKGRTLNLLLHQYATDNDGVYPIGEGTPALGKSEGIALDLLENNYTPDPSAFRVGSTPKYRGKAKDYSDLAAANVSWDFTAGATATTGLTSAAPDFLPMLYTTGQNVDYARAATGVGSALAFSPGGPFGNAGMVVAYKAGNAKFIPASVQGGNAICRDFIAPDFKTTSTFTQIRP